jgi:hypothetical protein
MHQPMPRARRPGARAVSASRTASLNRRRMPSRVCRGFRCAVGRHRQASRP